MDNSGANFVECIRTFGGFKRRYSYPGDYILVSIKKIRFVRKVRKGQILIGLITRAKKEVKFLDGSYSNSKNNIVLIMNQKKRLLGTRFFGWVSRNLRKKKFLRILIISAKHVI